MVFSLAASRYIRALRSDIALLQSSERVASETELLTRLLQGIQDKIRLASIRFRNNKISLFPSSPKISGDYWCLSSPVYEAEVVLADALADITFACMIAAFAAVALIFGLVYQR